MNPTLDMSALCPPRSCLHPTDVLTLSIARFALGDWRPFDETRALEILNNFFRTAQPNPDAAVFMMYAGAQRRMMARRQKSFEEIQSDPLFSEAGQKNCRALAHAYMDGGAAAVEATSRESRGPAWVQTNFARYLGGDGVSAERAIRLQASTRVHLLNAQYWLLFFHFGVGWEQGTQMRTEPDADGRSYDVQEVIMDGETQEVWFDTTDPPEDGTIQAYLDSLPAGLG